MMIEIKYRGIIAREKQIEFIKGLISQNPTLSRHALSRKLCEAWDLRQANGALRDMVCRGFLLTLHRAGHIKLPPKRQNPPNPFLNRNTPAKIQVDQTPVCTNLSGIKPLTIKQVRRTPYEKLFNSLIAHYHYLGYTQPVGEHLKYIIFSNQRPVACFAWSSAPRHIGARDRFIGWDARIRRQNIHLIAYNTRFLILDWIRVPYLASYLLGRMAKQLPADWQAIYNHPVYFLETFVDTELSFKGTCYKAANWQLLGKTTGRGKNDQTFKQNRSLKDVWGYPLRRDFRKYLLKDTQ